MCGMRCQNKWGQKFLQVCCSAQSSEASCLEDQGCHPVWIHVACRAAILEVSLALGLSVAADADGSTTIGNTPREHIELGCLVGTSHAHLVALTVGIHVLLVLLAKLLHGILDDGVATILTHGLGGVPC